MGQMLCSACAGELDFARTEHLAQQRMLSASVGFGRLAGAGGQLVGQAAGAIMTGAVGGVLRMASGAAHGVQQTVAGLQRNETPSPIRPRVLELMETNGEVSVSEAGSQEAVTATASAAAGSFESEVLEQLRALRADNLSIKAENDKLKYELAKLQGKDISPERFEPECQDHQSASI